MFETFTSDSCSFASHPRVIGCASEELSVSSVLKAVKSATLSSQVATWRQEPLLSFRNEKRPQVWRMGTVKVIQALFYVLDRANKYGPRILLFYVLPAEHQNESTCFSAFLKAIVLFPQCIFPTNSSTKTIRQS